MRWTRVYSSGLRLGIPSRLAAVGRGGLASLKRLGAAGLDFVYPPSCLLCRAELPPSPSPGSAHFCEACLTELTKTAAAPGCPRCGAPIGPYLDASNGCMHCRKDRFAFAGVIRMGTYDGQLRSACLRGKERGAEGLVAALAELAWQHAREQFLQAGIELVLPVPQHWLQRLLRPHNPAETLARIWSRHLRAEYGSQLAVKMRRTSRQVRLTPTQRRENVRNAFAVASEDAVRGRTVLIADDVLTTGATAHELARALRQAGAARVVVGVIARGLGQR